MHARVVVLAVHCKLYFDSHSHSLQFGYRLDVCVKLYTVSQKNVPLCDCPYLRQI